MKTGEGKRGYSYIKEKITKIRDIARKSKVK